MIATLSFSLTQGRQESPYWYKHLAINLGPVVISNGDCFLEVDLFFLILLKVVMFPAFEFEVLITLLHDCNNE